MKASATLYSPQQAHSLLSDWWQHIKGELLNGNKLELAVKPETRRAAQNRLLHAALTDVAAQASWAGKRWDVLVWKRLLTAAWLRANGQHAEMIPALDGHGFDVIYERTSELSVSDCADLITYILAWGAENGITFKDSQHV
jgi:hypothetical protein